MYLTRYGNELEMRAHPNDILCIVNNPLLLLLLPNYLSRSCDGFCRVSCNRIIVADSTSSVPLNLYLRILSRNRSKDPTFSCSMASCLRITRIPGRTVASDLRDRFSLSTRCFLSCVCVYATVLRYFEHDALISRFHSRPIEIIILGKLEI